MAAEAAPAKQPILKRTFEGFIKGGAAGLGLLIAVNILPVVPWMVGAGAVVGAAIYFINAAVSNINV